MEKVKYIWKNKLSWPSTLDFNSDFLQLFLTSTDVWIQ